MNDQYTYLGIIHQYTKKYSFLTLSLSLSLSLTNPHKSEVMHRFGGGGTSTSGGGSSKGV